MLKHAIRVLALTAILCVLPPHCSNALAQPAVATRITAVTVYPDRAMITRTGSVTLAPGIRQAVIDGLTPLLQDRSVRVTASGNAVAKILEVMVDRMYMDSLGEARAKPLLQKSRTINIEMRKIADRLAVLRHQAGFLDKIGIASQESISRDLKSTRPTVEDYKKLLTFFDTELTSVNAETRALEDQRVELQQTYDRIQQEIRDIGGTPEKSAKRITVRFDVASGGPVTIEASYLVAQASWKPVYDIRVASADTNVSLTYGAFVQQNTGEGWKDAHITLTTSRPNLGGTPPDLHPWFIGPADRARSLIQGVIRDAATGEPLPGVSVSVVGQSIGAATDVDGIYRLTGLTPGPVTVRATYIGYQGVRTTVFTRPFTTTTCDLDLSAESVSTAEVVVTADRPLVNKNMTNAISVGRANEVSGRAEEPPTPAPIEMQTASVTSTATAASFEIPGQTTIPADNAEHRVTVMTTRIGAAFSHSTVPKLQPDVFFRARLKNSTEFPLLPGAMSVYLDNSFLSTSKLAAVLPGESFDAYLGVDNGVRVERKLLNRVTSTSGLFSKTRMTKYDILIVVENRKKLTETVTIRENTPLSQDERLKVAILAPAAGEVAPDSNGIIAWQLTLAPGERKELRLSYTVEAPVDVPIGGLD